MLARIRGTSWVSSPLGRSSRIKRQEWRKGVDSQQAVLFAGDHRKCEQNAVRSIKHICIGQLVKEKQVRRS
jgi:hypothetical protein